MALSIGVSEGSKIKVGDSVVKVKTIVHRLLMTLTVNDGDDIIVSDNERTEIMPGVFVFPGVRENQTSPPRTNRLVFEAPRSVRIFRLEESHS